MSNAINDATNEEMYLHAGLADMRFAIPADAVVRVLASPIAIPLPDAPEGICGILYDGGKIFALRALQPQQRSPTPLAVLCQAGDDGIAVAADRVSAMAPLSDSERACARPAGLARILLLDRKERHD